MSSRLPWKLMAIILVVIVSIILPVWLAIDYLAADYFMALMDQYHISTDRVHEMFVAAVHRYLLWASLAASVLAMVLSFLLVRRVLGPLTMMTDITRDIAAGNYRVDIPVRSRDEVGQLATAFNRMTASLQKLEQLRRGMMVDVAHELRTPLTNIQGYLEALMDGVVPASKDVYDLLHEETLRLAQLVEDILQLAKADAARSSLEPERFDLVTLVAQTYERFYNAFEKKAIHVDFQQEPDELTVRSDRGKIIQVLQNLMQNAVQYTPLKGRVKIILSQSDAEAKVVFVNTGGEMAPEDLPYIFERFYRGEKSRSREHGGAGIGLAIVKELIESHGGVVGAEIDDNLTRIWFTLPLPA